MGRDIWEGAIGGTNTTRKSYEDSILRKIALLLLVSVSSWLFPLTVAEKPHVLAFSVIQANTLNEIKVAVPPPLPPKVADIVQKPIHKPLGKYYKGGKRLQCVVYARQTTGIDTIKGLARNVPTNSKVPQVGGAVKTAESRAGHIAVVIGIEGSDLILAEANYYNTKNGNITSGRRLPMNSPLIRGYIIKDN